MAKILKHGKTTSGSYSIVGLTASEFYTLFDCVNNEYTKAADLDNKYYNENEYEADKVIRLKNMLEIELAHVVEIS
jgi:hypothetical protein